MINNNIKESTINNKTSEITSFIDAVVSGTFIGDLTFLRPNPFPDAFINNLPDMNIKEITYSVLSAIIGNEIPASVIKSWVEQVLSFTIPLVEVSDCTYRLELFHGPTRTHKDIGAGFLAALLRSYACDRRVAIVSVVNPATVYSIGEAFADLKNITNIMLMPKGLMRKDILQAVNDKYSNARIAEMDCDRRRCEILVKDVIEDKSCRKEYSMTTANAFNPAILLMRIAMFFHAYARLCEMRMDASEECVAPVFIIPDSNVGMATAAHMAYELGLPIRRIITMPEARMERYGRFLEPGETAISMATFPASLSSDSPRTASGHKIYATAPALRKFISTI